MGFLKRIFGSGKDEDHSASQAVASEDLARIESELGKENRGRQTARLLNRSGDLYLVKGDRKTALQRYGEAIDSYLQAGEYDNAMAVCRKIIRVVPEVIRTRRTLAWLCLGKGFLEIAREHIDAYVDASKDAGLESLATQQLQLMAQYVERSDFREFLATKLEDLEEAEAARRIREGHASDAVRAAGWTPVVFAAMLTPEELRQGVELKAGDRAGDEFENVFFDFEPPEEEPAEAEKAKKSEPEAEKAGANPDASEEGAAEAEDEEANEAAEEKAAGDESAASPKG